MTRIPVFRTHECFDKQKEHIRRTDWSGGGRDDSMAWNVELVWNGSYDAVRHENDIERNAVMR